MGGEGRGGGWSMSISGWLMLSVQVTGEANKIWRVCRGLAGEKRCRSKLRAGIRGLLS